MLKYEVWVRCTETCPSPLEERMLASLDNRLEAQALASAVRDDSHMAQVREVAN